MGYGINSGVFLAMHSGWGFFVWDEGVLGDFRMGGNKRRNDWNWEGRDEESTDTTHREGARFFEMICFPFFFLSIFMIHRIALLFKS